MSHRYYLTQRGIAPGCQPKGFSSWVDTPEGKLTTGVQCYGYVEYERELTPEEIREYELTPHGKGVYLASFWYCRCSLGADRKSVV